MNFQDKRYKKVFAYKGSSGSIRDLQLHPLSSSSFSNQNTISNDKTHNDYDYDDDDDHSVACNYFASTGLDRFVRVFDIKTRKIYSQTFLIQKQNALLFTSDPPTINDSVSSSSSSDNNKEDDNGLIDDEAIWMELKNFSNNNNNNNLVDSNYNQQHVKDNRKRRKLN